MASEVKLDPASELEEHLSQGGLMMADMEDCQQPPHAGVASSIDGPLPTLPGAASSALLDPSEPPPAAADADMEAEELLPPPADSVHQQQQQRVAARTASSCSSDALQVELVNQLLSSPCPASTIVQPPGRLGLPLPRDGFMCDQCGDRFVLPSSLAQHMARRVMDIFYSCPDCAKTCLLSNKCQLLEHLDGHSLEPENLDPSLVEVLPLNASELCATTKVFPSSDESMLVGPPKLTQMARISKVNKPVYVSCAMCNVMCTSVSLSTHLCPSGTGDTLEAVPPRCPECAQPCPTECCLMAHQGLHKPNLWPYPYVCPECGLKMLSTFDEYRQHVISDCLHQTRDLKSCCSICFIEVGDITAHMIQTHVQKLYKCRQCPLAFESVNGFNSHVKGKHDGQLLAGDAPYMTILKCPFCSATFNNSKTLREHMASKRHGARVLELVKFVFRCPECDVDYGRKELLADHLTRSHPDFKLVTPETQPLSSPLTSPLAGGVPASVFRMDAGGQLTSSPAARGRGKNRSGRPPKYPRSDRQSTPRSGASEIGEMALKHVKSDPDASPGRFVPHVCIVCEQVFRLKSEYVEHARGHLEDGVPVCLLCNLQFNDEDDLKVHIAEHACEIGRDRCGLCYAKLGSRDALQNHLETEHNMRDFTCQKCGLNFERLAELNRHNYSKHSGGKPGRPSKRSLSAAAGSEEDDEDDLPLSVTSQKTPMRRGTLPNVTSLYELDDSLMATESPPPAVSPGQPRFANKRGRPRGGNTAAASRAAALKLKVDVDGPPRLQRAVGGQSPSADALLDDEFVEQPVPELPASGYRCVACGLESAEREAFIEHVRLHRQPGQHQCTECGQCYATEASLRKHLLLVHKLRQLPAEARAQQQQERWQQLLADLQPGQCHVCRDVVEDEAALHQHLRGHGLAQLRVHLRDQARRRRLQHHRQQLQRHGGDETLEDIAQFVAASEGIEVLNDDDDEGDEEVIELEMKEGEITQKQLRSKKVVVDGGESSDEEGEVPVKREAPASTNGGTATQQQDSLVAEAPAQITA